MALSSSAFASQDRIGVDVVIAIDKDKNSHYAVKWAVENLIAGRGNNQGCVLVHVRSQSLHPQDFDSAPIEGRPPTEAELQQFFLPFRGFCARKGIQAREVVLHDIDIPSALVDYVGNNSVTNIVVGHSNRNAILRKFKSVDVPTSLLKSAPESCSVYVISRGKVQISRIAKSRRKTEEATPPQSRGAAPPQSNGGTLMQSRGGTLPQSNGGTPPHNHGGTPPYCAPPHSNGGTPPQSIRGTLPQSKGGTPPHSNGGTPPQSKGGTPPPQSSFRQKTSNSHPHLSDSEEKHSRRDTGHEKGDLMQTSHVRGRSSTSNESLGMSMDSYISGNSSHQSSLSGFSDFSGPLSYRSSDSLSDNFEYPLTTETSSKSRNSTTQSTSALEAEMRKLKLELRQTVEMYDSACQEVVAAKHKARELQILRTKEEKKLEQAKIAEETALAIAEAERQKTKTATEAAAMAQRLAEMETQKRKYAEMRAVHEAEVKQKAMNALAQQNIRCRRYSIEDIEVATNYFNSSNKIGEGGYGPVYKGLLDHTSVAIKVLRPDLAQGQRQFQQEVEVLSCIRHPHMVLLLGVCPEYGCLVYEYLENGSLEDRLLLKDGTPPIPWKTRFKIASEIATALLFLHQTKPEPLVHRDLKPANILLNCSYVSKISDVGLARLVPPSATDSVTQYLMTAAAGTFCYIDPEYQQTGLLGVKSDIYSFGVMLLQIITAKSPMGLSHRVEQAINDGKLAQMLDPAVTDWPADETLSFAKLALKCCELRKKDRPDLGSVVLPELIRLRDIDFSNNPAPNKLSFTPQQRHYKSVPQMGSPQDQEGMKNKPNVEMEFNVDQSSKTVAGRKVNDPKMELEEQLYEANKSQFELQLEEKPWKSLPFATLGETRWKTKQEAT